jgi:hypothetical protein
MKPQLAPNHLTLPVDWWTAFLKQAQVEGISLSEWVAECCRANLPPKERRKLSGFHTEQPEMAGPNLERRRSNAK